MADGPEDAEHDGVGAGGASAPHGRSSIVERGTMSGAGSGGEDQSEKEAAGSSSLNPIDDKILGLRGKETELRLERKRVRREVRNTERRRSRIKKRARLLTNEDLHDIMLLRAHAAKIAAKAQIQEAAEAGATSVGACAAASASFPPLP